MAKFTKKQIKLIRIVQVLGVIAVVVVGICLKTTVDRMPRAYTEIPEGWAPKMATYTDEELGYSIDYPKQYYSDYGSCIWSEADTGNGKDKSFRPAYGLVPYKVFVRADDGQFVRIGPEYTYRLVGEHQLDTGATGFTGCEKFTHSYEESGTIGTFSYEILQAEGEKEIATILKQYDCTNSFAGLKDVDGMPWKEVTGTQTLQHATECEGFAGGGVMSMRYFPAQKKIVVFLLGQDAGPFPTRDGTDYKREIMDSFRFN